ncbi:hypothetical protein OG792_29480 [Micromonospora sp. NBC_01699]|uniref:allophanate hydrolase-related protein n=1 Tax=Micromonospora sp. NBC_01699 TaxID=2975984 RepID=UPI002E2C6D27|nr:hypothetical protein [Micromonospora sp. NBC_01699]
MVTAPNRPAAVVTAPNRPAAVVTAPNRPAAVVTAPNRPAAVVTAPNRPAAVVTAPNRPAAVVTAPNRPAAVVTAPNRPAAVVTAPNRPAAVVTAPNRPAAVVTAPNRPAAVVTAPSQPAAVVSAPERSAGLAVQPRSGGVDGGDRDAEPALLVAVVGRHLTGESHNGELVERGAVLAGTAYTAPLYRLYRLPTPDDSGLPGLVRVSAADHTGIGASIEVELWRLPPAALGGLLAGVPAPLGLGWLRLADGREVLGFLCEAYAAGPETEDISATGGWRAYRQTVAATTRRTT